MTIRQVDRIIQRVALLLLTLALARCQDARLLNPSEASEIISTATQINFYVSAAGNDLNPGTSKAPWKTIEKVNSWDFSPGNRVYFRGGDTFEGKLIFTEEDSGSAGSPIRVSSYGTGRATILANTSHAIVVYNAGYYEIKKIEVKSPDRTLNTGSGVFFYNDLPENTKLSYIRINDVIASGFGKDGIAIIGDAIDGTKSGYTNVKITNSEAYNNGHTGIATGGYWSTTSDKYANSDVYVANNVVHDNPGVPGYGNHSGSGIFLEDVDGGKIEKNIAYNNGSLNDYPGGGPVGIWAAVANNITIQFNESHHNHSKTVDGGGFDFDGGTTNSVMQYNYSHDNDGAGYLIWNYTGAPHTNANLTVRYNLSHNDGRSTRNGAIQTGGAASGPIRIYNNTVILDSSPYGTAKGYMNVGSGNTQFWNNILFGRGDVKLTQVTPRPTSTLQGNIYWSQDNNLKMVWAGTVYTSYQVWRSASGQETASGIDTGFNIDPRLVNTDSVPRTLDDITQFITLSAYKLTSESPLINMGMNLKQKFGVAPGIRDFYGTRTPVDTMYGIGAAEFTP